MFHLENIEQISFILRAQQRIGALQKEEKDLTLKLQETEEKLRQQRALVFQLK